MGFVQAHIVHAALVGGNQSTHLNPLVLLRASALAGCILEQKALVPCLSYRWAMSALHV